MRNSLVLLLSIFLCLSIKAQDKFFIPEVSPKYQNGAETLEAFIETNLSYPADAYNDKIKGDVLLSFVVTSQGVVRSPQLISNIGGGCGEEAIRLINRTHRRWVPAFHDGEPVDARVSLRIKFDPEGSHVVAPPSNKTQQVSKTESKKDKTPFDRAKILFDHGVKNFSDEKYSKAQHYFEQSLKINSDDNNALFNLALCKAKLEKVDDACKDLQTLIDKGFADAEAMKEKICE